MPELFPENEDAVIVWGNTRTRDTTEIKAVMEIYGIKNQQRCFEQIIVLCEHMQGEQGMTP